jgi:hypothetical protein
MHEVTIASAPIRYELDGRTQVLKASLVISITGLSHVILNHPETNEYVGMYDRDGGIELYPYPPEGSPVEEFKAHAALEISLAKLIHATFPDFFSYDVINDWKLDREFS